MKKEKVLILGASDNKDRYSYKAMIMLKERGHDVVLVHPTLKLILENKVVNDISQVIEEIDTVTIYVNPKISYDMREKIAKIMPKRVIFNPGSESLELEKYLNSKNIVTEEACTLVLLTTDQF